MIDPLDMIADILINYYPPIGNIEHKYRTKVTAIGLLKSVKMATPEYLLPFYERLMSYKLLIKNLTDNFMLSTNSSVKIFTQIIN